MVSVEEGDAVDEVSGEAEEVVPKGRGEGVVGGRRGCAIDLEEEGPSVGVVDEVEGAEGEGDVVVRTQVGASVVEFAAEGAEAGRGEVEESGGVVPEVRHDPAIGAGLGIAVGQKPRAQFAVVAQSTVVVASEGRSVSVVVDGQRGRAEFCPRVEIGPASEDEGVDPGGFASSRRRADLSLHDVGRLAPAAAILPEGLEERGPFVRRSSRVGADDLGDGRGARGEGNALPPGPAGRLEHGPGRRRRAGATQQVLGEDRDLLGRRVPRHEDRLGRRGQRAPSLEGHDHLVLVFQPVEARTARRKGPPARRPPDRRRPAGTPTTTSSGHRLPAPRAERLLEHPAPRHPARHIPHISTRRRRQAGGDVEAKSPTTARRARGQQLPLPSTFDRHNF
mmetsp:Transcript_24231/g.78150  ORF Transcript_24231/g.78150 Transcript_24231/m.78150 type:complete len:392 (-) Transcript_24231:220-1395(-)